MLQQFIFLLRDKETNQSREVTTKAVTVNNALAVLKAKLESENRTIEEFDFMDTVYYPLDYV